MLITRRYKAEDNETVKELHFAGIKQMYETVPGIARPDIPGLDCDVDDIEATYLDNNGEFLVGLEGKDIVAMGAIMKVTDTCAEVRRIRVRRDCQRKGYAEEIVKKLIETAERLGYKELTLDTMKKNYPAQRLFEKLGFEKTRLGNYKHVEVIYYGKKLDAKKPVLTIRRYRPEDNKAVKALHFAWIEQMQKDPSIAEIPRPPSHDADLDDIEGIYLNGGDFIVGLEGDEIVAMGAFKRRTPACAELKRLRIRPDKQRKGYGETVTRKLMELAVRMGYTEAFLDTLITNYRSQALAEKLGFKETGRGMRGPYHLIYYERKLENRGEG